MGAVSRYGRTMPRRADLYLAAALTAAGQIETWANADGEPSAAAVVGALLMTAPVAVRRRYPVLALAVAYTSVALQEGLGRENLIGLSPVIALLVLSYSVGAGCERPRSLAGAGIALTGAWTAVLLGESQRVDDFAFTAILALGPWLAGLAIRERQHRTTELAALAAQLEREREERARAAVTHERERIAREMHDVLAHSVSVMVVQAGAAERVLDDDREAAREAVASIRGTGKATLRELRRLLGLLRDEDDDGVAFAPQPGLGDIDGLVADLRAAGLPAELTVEGSPPAVGAGLELTAYRIVQEALTNTLKHAPGAHARVTIRYAADAIELAVSDDGPRRANGDGAGFGLTGMRERARLYGGTLDARPGRDGGFVVRARLPIESGGP